MDTILSFYENELEQNPSNLEALVGKIDFLFENKDFDAASVEIENYLKISKSNPHVHSVLGSILESKGEFELAANAYVTACELDGNNVFAQFGAGKMFLKLGQHEQALQYLDNSLSLDEIINQSILVDSDDPFAYVTHDLSSFTQMSSTARHVCKLRKELDEQVREMVQDTIQQSLREQTANS
ncbi:hypothetical protein BLNAU_7936 [Blattamonas nauphoetae]|uniref:Tetratricopeptide repeat protein n=1 Tax=Blattamonas nauphoetae TaxID=2049346 RepID=A0ABQ9Y041_9EUKA|nr:hypothetical protein BLNAU_7936 [Blattamonas nauphoetae]